MEICPPLCGGGAQMCFFFLRNFRVFLISFTIFWFFCAAVFEGPGCVPPPPTPCQAMEITLLEALVGFHKTVQHLDDRTVDVEREVVTPPGFRLVLKGEGMPKHHVPSERVHPLRGKKHIFFYNKYVISTICHVLKHVQNLSNESITRPQQGV